MTINHKSKIIKYITKLFGKTNPDDTETYIESEEIPRTEWEDYFPSQWNNFNFEGMVAPDETLTGVGILYGGYIDENNNVRGIIILFDSNFKPVKTIYEYDSGTKLRYIQCMRQAEDGTFYFIDDNTFSSGSPNYITTSQKRFVMVNNFTIIDQLTNDYKLTLRTSYNFSGNYVNFYCKDMYKNPNSSQYIFMGSAGSNNGFNITKVIGLQINVGEANTWTMYANVSGSFFGGGIAMYDTSNNVMFRCLATLYSTSATNLTYIYKTYTGSTTTTTLGSFSFYPYISDFYSNQCRFITTDEAYFVLDNQEISSGSAMDKYIGLYKYNFTDEELTTIYEKALGSYTTTNQEHIYIEKNQNQLYVLYNDNIDTNNNTADYVVQRLVNDIWSPPLYRDETNKGFVSTRRSLFVKNNFNLLQIYEYPTSPTINAWFLYVKKEDYNPLNYNGTEYSDYNSMLPKKAEIYNNNSIIFARNIYNSTIYENQTYSTIVVPNSYLNNLELTRQKLFSQTNGEIVNNVETITKNIYETLYLNFINTINVIDEDTNTQYPSTATYINTNINTGTEENYNNTNIGKIKVNKGANTFITNCVWQDITGVNNTKKAEFSIEFDNEISSIDFLSNDETTTYYSLNTSNWETGKIYNIQQFLRIE